MLTITDPECYRRHRAYRLACRGSSGTTRELGLTMLLFGAIGGIAWAIRGTTGWGGIDGTIVPGLTWAILWYYCCQRKGIDARGIVLWLGMGLALGGELGYGQYVSWIQGRFFVGDEVIPVSPITGYLWFVICGIGWGAPGGIVLGWALGGPATPRCWAVRVLLMAVLLAFIFNLGGLLLGQGIIEWLGDRFVRWWPGLLYPNADLGLYAGELDRHLGRTVYTNTQNFAVLLWWGVAMLVAAFQRDRATLIAGVVIGGGFGPGFAISAAWCHGYTFAPDAIDWWKVWELHSGFNLGLLYAIALYWAIRQVDKAEDAGAGPHEVESASPRSLVLLGIAGFILVFCAGYEYFFWTGLALAFFYLAAMALNTQYSPFMGIGCASLTLLAGYQYSIWTGLIAAGFYLAAVHPVSRFEFPQPDHRTLAERARAISIIYSTFLLVFLLLHGVTSRAVVVLGIHTDDAIDQYAWPAGRIVLFVPVALVLTLVTLIAMHRAIQRASTQPFQASPRLPERMYDLLTFIGVVGAASIWPAKIGICYALFLGLAIFALSRLNRHFDEVDRMI